MPQPASKAWNISLWAVQALLAALYAMAGVMKSTQPLDELVKTVTWAGGVPLPLVRFIGLAELAGALGLILPSLLRIQPKLTPWAGVGLATIMVLAVPFHIQRGELGVLAFPTVLGLLAAFVSYGRFLKAPIAARG